MGRKQADFGQFGSKMTLKRVLICLECVLSDSLLGMQLMSYRSTCRLESPRLVTLSPFASGEKQRTLESQAARRTCAISDAATARIIGVKSRGLVGGVALRGEGIRVTETGILGQLT